MSQIEDISILQDQLAELTCPSRLRIGVYYYHVPSSLSELRDNICWGQRLMMNNKHEKDLESFMFYVANYYQPIVEKKEYSEDRVMMFYRKIVNCHAHEIYPVLVRLVDLFLKMCDIEADKLSMPPDKKMRAAEIDRLKPFTDLNILQLISDKCKVPLDKAHLIDYNTVFALLWQEKETSEFQKRYNDILMASAKNKSYDK